MKKIDGFLKPGTKRWFEYHCWESNDSADAELWHRSHQQVEVLDCDNAKEYGKYTWKERQEDGNPLVYRIRFADGHVGAAFEDELLYRKSQFCRPNPPKRRVA